MEAKTKTFIKTSVDDNGMWLLTVPAGSAGNETVVVAVRRVEECRYGSEDSPGAHVSITCSLTLYGDGQSTPQTIVAKFEHGRVELFSVEFMLNEFLPRGRGVGSWIMQQMVLWTRSLPPETLVRQIHISSVDAKNIHNLIRRSRLWRGLGFRFPPGKPAQCHCGQTNCSCHGAGVQRSGWSPWYPRYAGWKTVIAGCRKNRADRRQKRSQKQLITSLRNRPFYHLWHRKGGQLPDEKCDALPLRAEKLSLPQSGDSDLEVAQRATGVIRLATLCSQSQEKIVELEKDLASQSEYLVYLQTNLLSILWEKVANQALFWGAWWLFWALSTRCCGHECSRSIATH